MNSILLKKVRETAENPGTHIDQTFRINHCHKLSFIPSMLTARLAGQGFRKQLATASASVLKCIHSFHPRAACVIYMETSQYGLIYRGSTMSVAPIVNIVPKKRDRGLQKI
jgi:hypothetical protein